MDESSFNDPTKPRGVSIPESLWECLKIYAQADMRTTSSYITVLLFEAINTRRQKLGLPAFDSLAELQAATQEKMRNRTASKAKDA
jgi:hypothetical protein